MLTEADVRKVAREEIRLREEQRIRRSIQRILDWNGKTVADLGTDSVEPQPDPIDSRPQVGDIVQITAKDSNRFGCLVYVRGVTESGCVMGDLVGEAPYLGPLAVSPGRFHVVGAAVVAPPVSGPQL